MIMRVNKIILTMIVFLFYLENIYADTKLRDQLNISSYIALTSNYVYRGLSFTEDTLTPQANISISHINGVFLNT